MFFARLIVTALLLSTLIGQHCCSTGYSQDRAVLVVEGPELENCLITIRYYTRRQLTKAIALKISLLQGRIEESLDDDSDGIEIFIQSKVAPLKARLVVQGQMQDQAAVSTQGELLKLSLGKIGSVEFTPESIEPSDDERHLFESFVKASNQEAGGGSMVSTAPDATLDAECLDQFLRELHHKIGQIDRDKSWAGCVGWDGNQDGRMLAGVLYGQKGFCGIRMGVKDGKLTELMPNCAELADDYIREPLETSNYVELAKRLTRYVFSGDAVRAHKLYAPQFQQQIRVEQLARLSETVRKRYGERLSSIELKHAKLLGFNAAKKNRLLHIDLLVSLEGGNRCLSRVVFSIPSDRTSIGRGSLGAINLTPLFQSAQPELAKISQALILHLGQGSLTAERLVKILPPTLQPLCDQPALELMLQRIGKQLANLPVSYEFDDWTLTEQGDLVQASGPVVYGSKDCFLELQFIGKDRLFGFSFYGPAVAESSMNLFKFPPEISQTAQQFWTNLLSGEAETAHAMLDNEFQAQFPLEQLKQQLSSPESRPSKLKQLSLDTIRLSHDIARPLPLMTTVILTAQFDDDETAQLACDINLPEADSKPLVFDFTNEFQMDFPVAHIPCLLHSDQDCADLAITAFQMADASQLLELIAAEQRDNIDRFALEAFMKKFRSISGAMSDPSSISRVVEYYIGHKQYRCNVNFQTDSGESIPIELYFVSGSLERFVVSHPQSAQFAELIEDTQLIRKRLDRFITAWFDEVDQAKPFINAALLAEPQLLTELRDRFVNEFGPWRSHKIVGETKLNTGNEIEFDIVLEGEKGQTKAKFLVEIGAFGGQVSNVLFQ